MRAFLGFGGAGNKFSSRFFCARTFFVSLCFRFQISSRFAGPSARFNHQMLKLFCKPRNANRISRIVVNTQPAHVFVYRCPDGKHELQARHMEEETSPSSAYRFIRNGEANLCAKRAREAHD
jgi:hypothetical protein